MNLFTDMRGKWILWQYFTKTFCNYYDANNIRLKVLTVTLV